MAAELTSSGVSQPAEEERRIAPDGKAYTWFESVEFFGEMMAAISWSSADIHRAAEERSGASDGHADVGGGYETAEQHPSAAPRTQSTASATVNTLLTDTPPPPLPMDQSTPPTAGNTPVTISPLPPPRHEGGAASAAVLHSARL